LTKQQYNRALSEYTLIKWSGVHCQSVFDAQHVSRYGEIFLTLLKENLK